ncbi:MAG: DUF655 domain-containing protein [Tissierellales bacterium]|jgi:competence protein ComEA|nr:DUF655 domain-containing protein [Tissierellales bacterium]
MSFFTKRKQLFILVVVGIFFIIGCWMNFNSDDQFELEENFERLSLNGEAESEKSSKIFVHICGCVKNPGVYEMDEGSRLMDVVESAGGFEYNADRESENLARVVQDEEKITIAEAGQISKSSEVSMQSNNEVKSSKVSINVATKAELEKLPGVGEKKAELIIQYRKEHKFKSIDEVKLIKGIGDKTYEKMKSLIRI